MALLRRKNNKLDANAFMPSWSSLTSCIVGAALLSEPTSRYRQSP